MSGAWSVEITRYINADSYDLMKSGECYGSFQDVESLRGFAQLLRDDLESGRDIAEIAREAYKEIIAAIEAVEA